MNSQEYLVKQKQDQVLHQAIDQKGVLSQVDMCIEECAELIQAINKLKRMGGISSISIAKPVPVTGVKYSLAYYNLCSEVADVRILLRQMEIMLDKESIDMAEQRKIDRLEIELKNNTNEA